MLAAVAYPVVLCGIGLGPGLFRLFGHDPLQHRLEVQYFTIIMLGAVLSALSIIFPEPLVRVFATSDTGVDCSDVVPIAVTLLRLAAIYLFSDFHVPDLRRGVARGG